MTKEEFKVLEMASVYVSTIVSCRHAIKDREDLIKAVFAMEETGVITPCPEYEQSLEDDA